MSLPSNGTLDQNYKFSFLSSGECSLPQEEILAFQKLCKCEHESFGMACSEEHPLRLPSSTALLTPLCEAANLDAQNNMSHRRPTTPTPLSC